MLHKIMMALLLCLSLGSCTENPTNTSLRYIPVYCTVPGYHVVVTVRREIQDTLFITKCAKD